MHCSPRTKIKIYSIFKCIAPKKYQQFTSTDDEAAYPFMVADKCNFNIQNHSLCNHKLLDATNNINCNQFFHSILVNSRYYPTNQLLMFPVLD